MIRVFVNALGFLVAGFILVLAHTVLTAQFAGLALPLLREGNGSLNVWLIRSTGVFAAIVAAFFIALPAGLILGPRLKVWGVAVAIGGWLPFLVLDPARALSMLPKLYVEFLALLANSALLYYWGFQLRRKGPPPNNVGPANGSQPIRSETNRTSGAAGSRR